MRHDAPKFLRDIRDAAEQILRHSEMLNATSFKHPSVHRDAVMWDFVILGEAFAHVRRVDRARAESFSAAGRIIAFRNRIIHGYGEIDFALVWIVITKHLRPLISQIEKDLEKESY